jgi:hypothetical protein
MTKCEAAVAYKPIASESFEDQKALILDALDSFSE